MGPNSRGHDLKNLAVGSMGNPYINPIECVFMGFFIPKNPKVEHQLNTMVVHVRERGTPVLVP